MFDQEGQIEHKVQTKEHFIYNKKSDFYHKGNVASNPQSPPQSLRLK